MKGIEKKDLTCGACQADIKMEDNAVIAVQLVRTDDGFSIFLTHPLCAAPRIRVEPSDVPYVQGHGAVRDIHYQAALKPTGECLLMVDIAGFVNGLPKRHRSIDSATQIYANSHGFICTTNADIENLPQVPSPTVTLWIAGSRAFVIRQGVGILDELDISAAGPAWLESAKKIGKVEMIACVGILRPGMPNKQNRFPIAAHSTINTKVVDGEFIGPHEDPSESIYKILNIAPYAHPTVFMLDSDMIVGIERWFYGKGAPFNDVMRRQLAGLLTVRSLMGSMHVDFTLGIAENCWGRFSNPVDEARVKRISRAAHTVMGMDSGLLMEVINSTKSPASMLPVVRPFPASMPKREATLQSMSYALALRLQILYRDSRGANTERKLRLLGEYFNELDRDLGFIGAYELQIACDLLFSGVQSKGYCELLLKPGKKNRVLENSWGAAWDITHMRRADLALRGIHADVPEIAALVSGDKALRLLRDRLTVHSPTEVQGVRALRMKFTPPVFSRPSEAARFEEITQHAHEVIDKSVSAPLERNIENARRAVVKYEGEFRR
ncbi:hypothetical protein [Streptomyces sp. NPDC050392]|uniref:hypothetical protein n=1 Tax=Streptomyces sp. NPDC050392 TaxID=3155782 RepID=UPI0034462186